MASAKGFFENALTLISRHHRASARKIQKIVDDSLARKVCLTILSMILGVDRFRHCLRASDVVGDDASGVFIRGYARSEQASEVSFSVCESCSSMRSRWLRRR